MFVELHNELGQPQRIRCTRVLILDELNNPLCAAVEWQPGAFLVTTCQDADFNTVLRHLGISQTVLCTTIQTTPLEAVRFDRTEL